MALETPIENGFRYSAPFNSYYIYERVINSYSIFRACDREINEVRIFIKSLSRVTLKDQANVYETSTFVKVIHLFDISK